MEIREILQWLSDNHRMLILLGGALCYISLYLPAWTLFTASSLMPENLTISISVGDEFWVFLILIIGIYFGYFFGYGHHYPYLFLGIGIFLTLYTIYDAQIPIGNVHFPLSYGIFIEFFGSLAVAVGGYFYYEQNKPGSKTT